MRKHEERGKSMKKRTVLSLILLAGIILSGCTTPKTAPAEMGDIPEATGSIQTTSKTSTTGDTAETQAFETTQPDDFRPEGDYSPSDGIAEGSSYPKPSSQVQEAAGATTTVPQIPGGEDITFADNFTLGNMGLVFRMPKGYVYDSGSADYAKFTNPQKTVAFYVFVRLNDPNGGDANSTRLMFRQKSSQLSFTIKAKSYTVWDTGYISTGTEENVGTTLFTRDVLDLPLIEKKSGDIVTPYATAAYFTMSGNSYAFVVVGNSNEIANVDKLSEAMLPTFSQAAIPALPQGATEAVKDDTYGVSFALPAGWIREEGDNRIIFRPDVPETDPLHFLQVTCFQPTQDFVTSYKIHKEIPNAIAASYLENPLTSERNVRTKITIVKYFDAPLASGPHINRYEFSTLVTCLTKGDETYLPNEGSVCSYMYTFDTTGGNAYAINISCSTLNRQAMETLAQLLQDTLKF